MQTPAPFFEAKSHEIVGGAAGFGQTHLQLPMRDTRRERLKRLRTAPGYAMAASPQVHSADQPDGLGGVEILPLAVRNRAILLLDILSAVVTHQPDCLLLLLIVDLGSYVEAGFSVGH